MSLPIGGICVGYGGLERAVASLLPVERRWHVEFNPAATTVLKAHYPLVPNHHDVTEVDWAEIGSVDVFAGGIPCQGFSKRGKLLGAKDNRDLWPIRKFDDAGRPRRGALDAIDALRPPLFLLENVDNLIGSGAGQNFATILADLAARGYYVSWTVVGACRVGACHHRHRTFLAASLSVPRLPASDPVALHEPSGWVPVQQVLFGDAAAVQWPPSGLMSGGVVWALPVDTCDDSMRLLPTVLTSEANGPGQHGTGGMDLRTTVSLLDPDATGYDRFGPFAAAVRRHEKAFDLVAPAPQSMSPAGKWQLSARFAEFLQGLEPGYLTDHLSRADAIVRAGNGVNWRQAAYAFSTLSTFRAAVAELTAPVAVAA
jgi:DNA (cytosine-5)-methyltransferase 1